MKLRPPAIPIITIDPYFSIWSQNEKINIKPTVHWTGYTQSIVAGFIVDGKRNSDFFANKQGCHPPCFKV